MQSTLSFERSKISDPYNKIPVINNKDGDEGEVVVAIETENQNLVFFFQYCSDLLWEKKCSSDLEKKLNPRLKAEQDFAKTIEMTQTRIIYSSGERSE